MSVDDKSRKEARRRLIKSAAAAPVVFTLPTGAALAQSSSTCQASSLERFATENPPAVKVASDNWVRAQFQALKFRVQGESEESGGFLHNSYYKVLDGSAQAVVVEEGSVSVNSEVAGYFVLVNAGDPATIILDSSYASAPIAGASCWNSVVGDGASNDNIIIP